MLLPGQAEETDGKNAPKMNQNYEGNVLNSAEMMTFWLINHMEMDIDLDDPIEL